jgi:hypothetical protein
MDVSTYIITYLFIYLKPNKKFEEEEEEAISEYDNSLFGNSTFSIRRLLK